MSNDYSTMSEAAIGIHELFKSMIDAGFTEPQALELVKAVLTQPHPQ